MAIFWRKDPRAFVCDVFRTLWSQGPIQKSTTKAEHGRKRTKAEHGRKRGRRGKIIGWRHRHACMSPRHFTYADRDAMMQDGGGDVGLKSVLDAGMMSILWRMNQKTCWWHCITSEAMLLLVSEHNILHSSF